MKFEISARLRNIFEWIYCAIIAIVLALLVRYYIGTPTVVKQPSMYPTLKPEQRLVLNRWGRTIKKLPKRGDIITFEAPSKTHVSANEVNLENPVAEYDNKNRGIFGNFVHNVLEIGKTSYIKRVIALPGEHVKIENGKVYINGEELEEEYLQPGIVTDTLGGAYNDFTVPDNCVFAMGDNRTQSMDCRRFGCIPLEKIEGKVWIRFWPLDLFGKVE